MPLNLSQYAGQYVAWVDGKIVSVGKTQLGAYKNAKKSHPKNLVTLEYIPTKKETLTFL